ncbi:MAG TPA: hypothetical protein VJ965_07810 [Anaerolineales bacterium]|nr:hypothetical protein [Anaerolineales bacterium]
MRFAFLGGFAGQLVSGLIWLAAAAVSTWHQTSTGMAALFFGCMLIFPLTQATLKLLGLPARVSDENLLWGLGSQVAFTVPINFLLVGAATLHQENWFFPAALIVVGAHYFPFITLYGMKLFAALAGVMTSVGAFLGLYYPGSFSLGGWIGAGTMILFAFIGRALVLKEQGGSLYPMVQGSHERKR